MFRMKGVIPSVVTPFQKNGEVDYEGVRKLAAFLKKNVDGMFITGSYGSCALLTMEERKKSSRRRSMKLQARFLLSSMSARRMV